MTAEEASEIASVLGSRARMTIFQILLQAGPQGLIVGEIQRRLNLRASTLSHHLERLRSSGLVTARRHGTFLWYRPAVDRLNGFANTILQLAFQPVGDRPSEPAPATPPVGEIEIEAD